MCLGMALMTGKTQIQYEFVLNQLKATYQRLVGQTFLTLDIEGVREDDTPTAVTLDESAGPTLPPHQGTEHPHRPDDCPVHC